MSEIETADIGLGQFTVGRIGVGAMPWSDSRSFGYGSRLGLAQARQAFDACLGAEITLVDTAELYGFGKSERIVGKLVRASPQSVCVATKYAPYPWRFTRDSVSAALRRSLRRLDREQVDLYQIHFPSPVMPVARLMEGLADAVEAGLTRCVGVSNFSAAQTREAHEVLARRSVALASNQVEYSLVRRRPEKNGVLEACRELDVTLIAYSPLGRGVLSGKYRPGASPSDMRRRSPAFKTDRLEQIQPLIEALREVGAAHDNATPAQVALNWLARQSHVLPIPGAKNATQARENLEAVRFAMSDDETDRLDVLSKSFS